MTYKEVQQKLIDLISLDNYVLSVSEASEKLNISPRQVEANMLYLVQNKFADIWCNMRGLEGISRNLHTLSFCAYPDQTSQHTIINVYGLSLIHICLPGRSFLLRRGGVISHHNNPSGFINFISSFFTMCICMTISANQSKIFPR